MVLSMESSLQPFLFAFEDRVSLYSLWWLTLAILLPQILKSWEYSREALGLQILDCDACMLATHCWKARRARMVANCHLLWDVAFPFWTPISVDFLPVRLPNRVTGLSGGFISCHLNTHPVEITPETLLHGQENSNCPYFALFLLVVGAIDYGTRKLRSMNRRKCLLQGSPLPCWLSLLKELGSMEWLREHSWAGLSQSMAPIKIRPRLSGDNGKMLKDLPWKSKSDPWKPEIEHKIGKTENGCRQWSYSQENITSVSDSAVVVWWRGALKISWLLGVTTVMNFNHIKWYLVAPKHIEGLKGWAKNHSQSLWVSVWRQPWDAFSIDFCVDRDTRAEGLSVVIVDSCHSLSLFLI